MSASSLARRLVAHTPGRPVISLYLDLDPERFATPPARASQVRSLLDGAARQIEEDTALDHESRASLREDIERLDEFLADPPAKGARALAVFSSNRDGLFETVTLTTPADGRVVIADRPYVEPLVTAAPGGRWLIALVSRRHARFFTGEGHEVAESRDITDSVHGQHGRGGWSQANYERSIEEDVDRHMRRVAETIGRTRQGLRFERLALGGTSEDVARLEKLLDEQSRAALAPQRLDVEVEHATEAQVSAAMHDLLEEDAQRRERDALDRLAAGVGTGGHAVGGPDGVVEALNQRRVESLLLAVDFDREVGRCRACGTLVADPAAPCPVDGEPLNRVGLREAAVESAVAQDGDTIIVTRFPDLGPFQGIAALLRF
jgi:peptide subunit release factor 1 (eRF1)